MPQGWPHPHLSPLSLVWPGAGQSHVLLAGQWDANGDRLWHGEPRQHLGAERSCEGAAVPCLPHPKGHKTYLGHEGIGQTGAALGATRGWRQFLQEGEGSGCWCRLPAAPTGCPGSPRSPAAGAQRWASRGAAGAVWGGRVGRGCSGEGPGCRRSCGGLCRMGCHHQGLGTCGAAWGAVREQGRARAACREPPALPPEPPWGKHPHPSEAGTKCCTTGGLSGSWSPFLWVLHVPAGPPPYLSCSFSTTKSLRRP